MFFPRKQKEKKPNTAVKYEVREFIHGGIEYMQQIALLVSVGDIRTLCIRSVLSNAIFVSIRRKTIQKQGL